VFKSRHRWRWLWWTVGLVGLAGAAAASFWLFLIVRKQSGQHSGAAAFLAVAAFVAAVAQVLLAWLQLRQGIRRKPIEQLAPHERRERDAYDRLRQHLGRRKRLRRMDDPATLALALRVHPAIDLPQTATSTATAAIPMTGGHATGRHHRLHRQSGARPLDRDLPTFVDRDKGPALRDWLREARDKGGFLVLVGDSSVGKTRLLYEAARKVLGDFAVLAPDLGDGGLVNKIAEGTFPMPKLIIWLDELQRFLDGPYLTPGSAPITSATVRRLLEAPTPVIIVGTLWPIYDEKLCALEPDPVTGTKRPRHPNALDILDDQRLHRVYLETFSSGERTAAGQLTSQDPRLAEALASPDYNVTEVLAGAPELMRRYDQATEEQKAVLHTAIDARRVGIQALLSEQLLREAARGYLSTIHPGDTWFPPALNELTRPKRGTAPLIPAPNADYSQVLGFTVADYLLQHLTRRRRRVRLSGVTWQALARHTHDPDDVLRLGDAARSRLLYNYAESAYRSLADTGDGYAAGLLADLLAQQGRVDEAIEVLRVRADAGDWNAGDQLADLLARQGRVDEAIEVLRVRTDAGDWNAGNRLADLLAQQGRIRETIEVMLARGRYAPVLPSGLAHKPYAEEAVEILQVHADTGNEYAAALLADLLIQQGRIREAIEVTLARAGGQYAPVPPAGLLAHKPYAEEAVEVLRVLADAGNEYAAALLADLLIRQGRAREAIEVMLVHARGQPASVLPDGLRFETRRANEVVEMLRVRADAGDEAAAALLADVLHGERIWYAGMEPVHHLTWSYDRPADLLAEQGRIDELRALADAGDAYAANLLVGLLAKQGRVDEAIETLRAEVDAGTSDAAGRLITMLTEQGKTAAADQMRRFGLNTDGSIADGNPGIPQSRPTAAS
jgi:tetratricopeptide (TPR) repeat protein